MVLRNKAVTTACYERSRLRPGNKIDSPALIFQFDTTLVIAPDWTARVDQYDNILVQHLMK